MPLAYAGAMLFPLATLGLFARRPVERGRTIFLLFLAAGLLAGASAPGLLDLLSRLPGFSLALNYRLVFLAALGLAGLAAYGVEEICREGTRRASAFAAGWVVLLVVAFLLARGIFHERGLPGQFVALSFAIEVVPLLLFALLGVLSPGQAAAAGALLLVLAQRCLEMSGTYPTLLASALAPRLPALETLTSSVPARVVATDEVFRPNAAALYRVEDVRGYESIVLDRLADTFPLWSTPQSASFNRVEDLSRPFLAFLNARYAIEPPNATAPAGWMVTRQTVSMTVSENPRAMPRAFVPKAIRYESDPQKTLTEMRESLDFSQTAWVERSGPARSEENEAALLELRAAGPDLMIAADAARRALVATSIPAWPGWRAESGSREPPIIIVNHAFVGFFVPSGRSLVRLYYRPRSWDVGVVAMFACLSVLAVAGCLRVRKKPISPRTRSARTI